MTKPEIRTKRLSLVAFDTLFEVFHQLFFAGGSYTFDPATERLVQLFPFAFWQESAVALGVVAIVVAIVVAVFAERHAGRVASDGASTAPTLDVPGTTGTAS